MEFAWEKSDAQTYGVLSGVRERELEGVIYAICRAWDRYDMCIGFAIDDLHVLEREIQAAADLIGHKDWRTGGPSQSPQERWNQLSEEPIG